MESRYNRNPGARGVSSGKRPADSLPACRGTSNFHPQLFICLNRFRGDPSRADFSGDISITITFESLGLLPELLRAIAEKGYESPTPIQAQAIPVVLSGRDLLGAAQTGTGKTAGFTLPLLQRLAPMASKSFSPAMHPVRCLILTPTRELAIQVHDSVKTYGKHIPLRPFVVYGGININPQIQELRKGVEILVATPGRLLDLVGQKAVDLRQVQILVLDEADRMLDMGFIPDIKRIINLLPPIRQNLLFSATFSDEIRRLSAQFLRDPVSVEVARRNTPAELVTQYAYHVDSGRKRALLAHLVKANDWSQVLVFCKTKHGANRLAAQLVRDGINADAIHGNKAQNARVRTLEGFKAGEIRVMVATDIAARGLDIEALPHVVNYDLPHVPEDYVHRIGRTGRAGLEGEALSLVSGEDRPLIEAIERLIKKKIERREAPGFQESADQIQDARQPERERGSRGGGGGRRGAPGAKPAGYGRSQGQGQGQGRSQGGQGSGQERSQGSQGQGPRQGGSQSQPQAARTGAPGGKPPGARDESRQGRDRGAEPREPRGRREPPRGGQKLGPPPGGPIDFNKPYVPSTTAKAPEVTGEAPPRRGPAAIIPALFRRKT